MDEILCKLDSDLKSLLGNLQSDGEKYFCLGMLFGKDELTEEQLSGALGPETLGKIKEFLDSHRKIPKLHISTQDIGSHEPFAEVLGRLRNIEHDLRLLKSPVAKKWKYPWTFEFDERRYRSYLVESLEKGNLLVAVDDIICDGVALYKSSKVEFIEYNSSTHVFTFQCVPEGNKIHIENCIALAVCENHSGPKDLDKIIGKFHQKNEKELQKRSKLVHFEWKRFEDFKNVAEYDTYLLQHLLYGIHIRTEEGEAVFKRYFYPKSADEKTNLYCQVQMKGESAWETIPAFHISIIEGKSLKFQIPLWRPFGQFSDEIGYWAYLHPLLVPGMLVRLAYTSSSIHGRRLTPGALGRFLRTDPHVPMKLVIEWLPCSQKRISSVLAKDVEIWSDHGIEWKPLLLKESCEAMFLSASDGLWRTGSVGKIGNGKLKMIAGDIREWVPMHDGRICEEGRYPELHRNAIEVQKPAQDVFVICQGRSVFALVQSHWQQCMVEDVCVENEQESILVQYGESLKEWVPLGVGKISHVPLSDSQLNYKEMKRTLWNPLVLEKGMRIDAQDGRGGWFAGVVKDVREGECIVSLDGYEKSKYDLYIPWDSGRLAHLGTFGAHHRSTKGIFTIVGSHPYDVIIPGSTLQIQLDSGDWATGVVEERNELVVCVNTGTEVVNQFIWGGKVAPIGTLLGSGELFQPRGFDNGDHLDVGSDGKFVNTMRLVQMDSHLVTGKWLNTESVPKEYQKAIDMCKVSRKLMKDTKLSRIFEYLDNLPVQSDSFETILERCIRKAYKDESPKDVKCIVWNANIFGFVCNLYQALEWRQKYLSSAMSVIEQEFDSDRMLMLLAELTKGGIECVGRKRHAFHTALRLLELPEPPADDTPAQRKRRESDVLLGRSFIKAKQDLYSFIEEWTEEFKYKAFGNAFLEPAQMYFRVTGRDGEVDNVLVHGINAYSTILMAVLSVRVPFNPYIDDEFCNQGLVDFMGSTSGEFLKGVYTLYEPEYFGRAFSSIPACPKTRLYMSDMEKAPTGKFIFPGRTPRELANNALDPLVNEEACKLRRKLAEYLEGFMRFFSVECYGEKLLSNIVQQKHLLMQTVFDGFRSEQGIEEEDYRFWLWDPMDGTFRLNRAESLLEFLGVLNVESRLDSIAE